ncbi:unnamed protein product [Orchesella dallaii]|uniref:Uncharacterized protein n=1 Tax=Orchesella dallaii TaxID=48710 RepID=A0ABP1RLI8_9HEXA
MDSFFECVKGSSTKVGKVCSWMQLNSIFKLIFYTSLCCPSLLSGESVKILKIKEELTTSQLLSYVTNCLLLDGESVVIISDKATIPPNVVHVDVAFVVAQEFVSSDLGFFLRFDMVQTSQFSAAAKRTNFIFTMNSKSEVQPLISKVDEELKFLQISSINKLIWQPFTTFLWMETDQSFESGGGNAHFIPSQNHMNSWFEKYKPDFTIGTGVFFVFMALTKEITTQTQCCVEFFAWEVYNLKHNLIIEAISNDPFLNPKYQSSKLESGSEKYSVYTFLERFRRRSNFRGVNIAAAVPEEALKGLSDWIAVIRVGNGNTSKIKLDHGFSVNIFHDLQLMMNFEEEVILGGKDKQTIASNETQMPLIPELNTDKADISLYQASMYKDRAEVCTFLQPTYSGIYRAFFQQPTASSIRDIVSAPFKAQLWLTLFATWIFLVGFIHCWASLAKRRQLCSYYRDNRFVDEIGMWVIAASCQKCN